MLNRKQSLALAAVLSVAAGTAAGDVITQWTFNSNPSDGSPGTGTFVPSLGVATAAPTVFGGLTQTPFDSGSPGDAVGISNNDNSSWRVANNAPQGLESGGRGVQFSVSTAGYSSIMVQWDQRYSSTASKYMQLFYSTDGTSFTALPTVFSAPTGDAWVTNQIADLSAVPGVANNPNFKFRIAAVFEPSTSAYVTATAGNTYGSGGNTQRYDMVTVSGIVTSTTGPTVSSPLALPGALCTTGGTFIVSAIVQPGQLPTSTGLSVTANLVNLGGGTVSLLDNGLNGDTTAGDGTYSAQVTVGANTAGAKSIAITASDLQGRNGMNSASVNIADCTANSASRVVISQVYGGGSNAGPPVSPLNADYVELYNRSAQVVDLTGWSVQYASPTDSSGFANPFDRVNLSGVIQPGQYLLVRYKNAGNTGAAIPTPDFAVGADVGGLGNNGGRVALVRSTSLIGTNCADASVEDLVGYGDAAICFEGGAPTATTANDAAAVRKLAGGQDSDQNFNDFAVSAPNPRNRSFGGFIAAYGAVDQANVCRGQTVRITATAVGATSPASTLIQVRANLTAIGGTATDALFDDGTHGDAAIGDGVYTLDVAVSPTTAPGVQSLALTILDAQGRSDTSYLSLGVADCTQTGTAVVISQVYGGGGNEGSAFDSDFVEIFNRSGGPVSLAGWSVQYADAAASFGGAKQINLSGTIGAGEYRLARANLPGANGGVIPTPDFVASNPFGMDNQFGKVALVSSTTPLLTSCTGPTIVDFVGYGVTAGCYEGLAPTGAIGNTIVALRRDGGCHDTNQNALDFEVGPALDFPRNSASPAHTCPQPTTGACCHGTTCVVDTAANCTGANKSYAGNGVACNASGNNTTPCCKADFNHTGGVAVSDIFEFLNAWFAGNSATNITGNGVGALSVQNIFDFLNAWFAGC